VIACLNELGLLYKLTPPADYYVGLKDKDYLAKEHPFEAKNYDINYNKHNNTILVPHDIREVIKQFMPYESFYYDPPVSKMVFRELYVKYMGKTSDPAIINQAREKTEEVLNIYDKLLEGKEYLN
ncbi:33266_t:CDS:2, partial [Racocetra persica]